ncbi:hypothetical protein C8R44DRAFT_974392 [Mycena epipterygia]|nr:hypothetical protein C8R44DRAFT_974392 [Mycena epipterygia]
MTEYDYSPEAYHQFKRTQNRIANWVDDTDQCSPQFKSPFVPRSDVRDNDFYNNRNRSASSSRSRHSSPHSQSSQHNYSHSHSQRPPTQRSNSHGYPQPTQPQVRSPLRAQTISLVTPNDSVSQVTGPRSPQRHSHRARSHSPTRHSSRHSRRSGTYVVSPGGVQYAQPVQYTQPVQYAQPMQYAAQPPPAAYVVIPRDRKVQIVYQEPQYNSHEQQHQSGGFLQRIFGSQGGKHGRSRSMSHSRSSSRSRR